MKAPQLEQERSFREAAAILGRKDPSGRKLRQLVVEREKQTGKRIAIRCGGTVREQLRVTMGALYRAFPELQTTQGDKLAADLKATLHYSDDLIRELVRSEVASLREGMLLEIRELVYAEVADSEARRDLRQRSCPNCGSIYDRIGPDTPESRRTNERCESDNGQHQPNPEAGSR